MSDKNINLNLQRTTRSKSKVLSEAEKLSKENEKDAFSTISKLVHSPPLKPASTETLGTKNQNFSEIFYETLTNDNNQDPILNLPSIGNDYPNKINPNQTPSNKKINFQIKGSPSLEFLKKYQDNNSIISSSVFNKSKSLTENSETSEPVNSTVIPADASLTAIDIRPLLPPEKPSAPGFDECGIHFEAENQFDSSNICNLNSINTDPLIQLNMNIPNNQQVSLRDALEIVPIFDGRSVPLVHFIEGCEEAKQMLPPIPAVEQNLVKMIRSKIIGEARKCIYGMTFEKVDDLINRLKKIYSPSKTVYQLQGELGSTYMWERESVLSYATRIKEIADQIYDAHRINNGGQLDETFKAGLEKDLIQCFLRGLRPEIEIRVEQGEVFKDVTNNAIEVERRLNAAADLRKGNIFKQKPDELEENTRSNRHEPKSIRVNYTQGEVIICQFCNKRGHTASACRSLANINVYTKNPHNRVFNRFSPQQNMRQTNQFWGNRQTPFMRPQWQSQEFSQDPRRFPQNNRVMWELPPSQNNYFKKENFNPPFDFARDMSNIICNYCKKPGHMIKDCRRREYNNKF